MKSRKIKFLRTPWKLCLNRKITMTSVKAIRKMIADSVKFAKIATYFDVTSNTIRKWSTDERLENSRLTQIKYNKESRLIDYSMKPVYQKRASVRKAKIMPDIIAYHASGQPLEA